MMEQSPTASLKFQNSLIQTATAKQIVKKNYLADLEVRIHMGWLTTLYEGMTAGFMQIMALPIPPPQWAPTGTRLPWSQATPSDLKSMAAGWNKIPMDK